MAGYFAVTSSGTNPTPCHRRPRLVRRLITNTPLQPLIFLNDRSFFESARELARRVARESGGDPELQLARAWRLLIARSVTPQELAVLTQLFEQQRALFGADPAAAAAVCGRSDPSFAALTLVCSTLLTSDAVITTR